MARSDRQLHLSTFLSGSALTLSVITVYLFGGLDGVEGQLYDARAQQCQRFMAKPTNQLVHVDIDDASLEAAGAWPWPRTLMGELIDEMSLAGTKVIALDILYIEPQNKEWMPSPDRRTFFQIDHDANLAAAFRRAGNVLLPTSLSFDPTRPQTPVMNAAVAALTSNPELSAVELVTSLQSKGFSSAQELADVGANFFGLRREAVQIRVEQELPHASPAEHGQSTSRPATTAPTTRPATGPSSQPSTGSADASADIRASLKRTLFPKHDWRLNSAESRLVDDAYELVNAMRALDRFGRRPAKEVSVFSARSAVVPLRKLIESAAASAFVDYPKLSRDGTVRNMPLFIQHRGRLFPQMGLQIACMLLEVDLNDLKISEDRVVIPAGTLRDGTQRAEVSIPVRTTSASVTGSGKTEFPLLMDIPWFGTRHWESMYDPSRPNLTAQHLSISRVIDLVRIRERLEENSRKVDEALVFFLAKVKSAEGFDTLGLAPERAKAYFASPPKAEEVSRRLAVVAEALKLTEESGIAEQLKQLSPSEKTAEDRFLERELTVNQANLQAALRELPGMDNLLRQRRAELRTVLGGKAALLGWTALAAVADQKPTPLHPAAPGVVIHGVTVNALLTRDLWRTLPPWVTVVVSLVLGLLVTTAVALISPAKSFATAVFVAIAYALVNGYILFDYGNLILDLGAPLFAISGSWAGGTVTRLIIEARERARITRRFATYVDPDLVSYCVEVRDPTMFTGQRRDSTIVFTDLEGFTNLSEKLKDKIVPVLNDFMGRAVRVIKEHHGFVNKFLGDGIMFFFNAPRPNAKYVNDAVQAILGLQAMMVKFNEDLAKQNHKPLRLRAAYRRGP